MVKLADYHVLQQSIPLLEQRHAIYAQIEALVSPTGLYGHFGGYLREIMILRVIEMRLATPHEKTQRRRLEELSRWPDNPGQRGTNLRWCNPVSRCRFRSTEK